MDRRGNVPSTVAPLSQHQSTQPSCSSRYQSTECVLYGSILSSQKDNLLQRLRGLCDPSIVNFQEHNMCFKLSTLFIIYLLL